jgi:cell division septation protein DedD
LSSPPVLTCWASVPLKKCNRGDMARKNTKKATGKGKGSAGRYHFSFSLSSLFFWSFCLLFLLGWIFVLGILVGRGVLPDGVHPLTDLAGRLTGRQGSVSEKVEGEIFEKKAKDPEFAFFEQLSIKKEEATKEKPAPKKVEITKEKPSPKQNVTAPREIPRSPDPPPSEGKPQARQPYTLQLASLENEHQAAMMVVRLNARGHPAYLSKAEIKGKSYYRVRCGTFDTEKEGNDYRALLLDKEGLRGVLYKVE